MGAGHLRPLFKHVTASKDCSVLDMDQAYTPAMPRKLVWIENANFEGFGCSECNWVFKPASAIVTESLDEMKRKYEAERDKEFTAHVCAQHRSPTNPKAK
jgi:hypothetical protein